jgi:hypothetical protein
MPVQTKDMTIATNTNPIKTQKTTSIALALRLLLQTLTGERRKLYLI